MFAPPQADGVLKTLINQFFLYDLLYTNFSSFIMEYIYEKQYRERGVLK